MQNFNIGIYSHSAEISEGFDIYFNYLKEVTGEINNPVENSHNIISCFADNETANQNPELVSFSGKNRAVRSEDKTLYCDWICRSHTAYRTKLFNLIEKTDKYNIAGIHLDSVSMPGVDYCVCNKCITKMKNSGLSFNKFRTNETTNIVKQISEITQKQLSLTLYPDPFYQERYGLDIDALSQFVDFFLIPLYDISYQSLYWIDILAHAFAKRIKKDFYIMLYAPDVDLENLKKAASLISKYTNNIIISYDNAKAYEIYKMLKK